MAKKCFAWVVFLLLFSVAVVGCSSSSPVTDSNSNAPGGDQAPAATEKSSVRIGTSSSGSPFYTIAVGISEIINKHATSLNATAEPVGGSDPNIFALQADKIDLAVVNSLSSFNGYYAKAPFEKPVEIGVVAQGQDTYRQIIVRKESGIENVKNLEGKKFIAVRPALPEIEQISLAILNAYQIPKEKVQMITTVDTKEALEALKIGSVDAAMLPASLNAAEISELFSNGEFGFLSIDEDKMDGILSQLPKAIVKGEIPAGMYPNQEQAVSAFKFNTYLVANNSLSEETVYNITKSFFDHHEEFAAVHNTAKRWTLDNTLKTPAIPYHPGAIKYFKEIGKWNDDMEKMNASLQQR